LTGFIKSRLEFKPVELNRHTRSCRAQVPWAVSIPAASLVRSLGLLASLAVSSWLLRENLLALIAGQMATLAEQVHAHFTVSCFSLNHCLRTFGGN
jgi:hypothetical protein